MSLHESAVNIVEYVGGEGNIQTFSHCATRLRFTLADDKLVKEDKLKETKGVLGIVNKGGQYQVVIGPTVEKMYNEITPLLKKISNGNVDVKAQEKEKTKFDVVMSYISGAISPVLPVLIGAGMINAVLAIANLMGLAKDSGTYQAWAQIANIGFTYLPVFVAFSAARKLRTNEYIAAMISLAMIVCFNQQDGLSVFGAAIPNIKFANSIIPVLMMVPVMKIVDDLCNKVIPAAAHFTIKPLILLGIMAPFTLFVFGPIGAFVGGTLANMCIWLMEAVGPVALAILSGLHAITVMFGMHYLFTPIMTNEVAETGYTFVLCRALAANFAMAGAAMAVGVKAKNPDNKSIGFSSSVTALLSVTEPALYGCLIRLRKPLISACIAATITGAFLGLFKVRAYAIASPCLLSLPIFIGGDSMINFILALVGMVMAFLLGFIITYVFGFKEED